ncbi:MAG: hypothetical protein JW958_14130 [Candidatus Eisenbacteria bacterium]|nr:hypothetical protein [Candidatus Eisenbacteria bacterium]
MRKHVPFALALLLFPSIALAVTGYDLSGRIVIDGYSSDFETDEAVFVDTVLDVTGDGLPDQVRQERDNDSKWGFNNDINQIKITWDAENLYVAVDGISWDNNIILLFDYLPGGLDKMTELNSWRRNFVFAADFYPDLFWATWDGNATPQIWRYLTENQVEQVPDESFETVATFQQGNTGRSMEARIPWDVFYGETLERRYVEEARDSVPVLPVGLDHSRSIRMVAVLTAGGDGTGGPDSAPDNLSGHEIDSSIQAVIDNYVFIPLDTTYYETASGRRILDPADTLIVGESGTVVDAVRKTFPSDGSPDMGVGIVERRWFLFTPPFPSRSFTFRELYLNRPVINPEEGEVLHFTFALDPEPNPNDPFDALRGITVTAEIYDMRGRMIRTLAREDERSVIAPENPELDRWDCRDVDGDLVPGGIYILRFVVEPGVFRTTKAFSVIR